MKNKKLLSLFLAVLMLVAIPFSVFAEDTEENKQKDPAVVETVEEKEVTEEETPAEAPKEVVQPAGEVKEEATEAPKAEEVEGLEVSEPLMKAPLKEPAPGSIEVKFELNGGTGTASANVISGQTVDKPADPKKDNFIFAGWYTDATFATEFDFTKPITATTTIYAKWTPEPTKYTVTFKNEDTETLVKVVKDEKVPKPADPTKTGYNFLGWYEGDTKFDFNTAITADKTLTAKWEAKPVVPVVKALNISERSYSNGKFYGKVTDSDGVGVKDATVSLYNYNGSLVRTAVTTDENGYFEIYVGDYYYGYYDGYYYDDYYYDDYYYDDYYYDGVRYYRDGNRWYYYVDGVKHWTDYRPYWNGKYYGKYYDGRYYGGYLLASKTDYTTSAKYYLNDGRYWDGYYYNRYYYDDYYYYNKYDHKVYPTDITRTNYSAKGYLKGYPNRTVYVYDNGTYLGRGTIDSNGYFSVTWSSPYVATGRSLDYYVDGKYVSDSGYSGAPIVNAVSAGSTFVRGTAGANATVTVYDASGITLGSTTAGSTGIYNVTLNRALRAGEVITVEAKEAGRVARTTNYTVGGQAVSTEKVSQPAYIAGFPDGTFKPGKEVTRAEAVRMFVKLVNNGAELPKNPTTSFKDANNAWYSDEINYAVAKGFIKGYSDGTFKPNQAITRAEFAQMISVFVKNGYPGTGSFKDVKGHWASDAISALYGNKNIKGYSDGTFKPNQKLTRAEAVTILNSVFGRNTKSTSFANVSEAGLKRFSDVAKSHWAYYEILDASNGHNAAKIEGIDQVSIWQ
ncbi:S-layer homology domain-containing protein [uncultured Peptoniphilus sp.]|uniref:S-layer homology domain-containing protein n=1 Tax=uncultured Peptoniphilus sp. TaxID=254354 RepID=UPI0026375584|nr:S-layer homology domain-containing protein [uncultured Peptoniphilus sp.]